MKLRLPFDFTIHWGEPRRELHLSAQSVYRYRVGGDQWMEHRYRSEVERWYGFERRGILAVVMLTRRIASETVPALATQDSGARDAS